MSTETEPLNSRVRALMVAYELYESPHKVEQDAVKAIYHMIAAFFRPEMYLLNQGHERDWTTTISSLQRPQVLTDDDPSAIRIEPASQLRKEAADVMTELLAVLNFSEIK